MYIRCELDLPLSEVCGMEPVYKVHHGLSYTRCPCREISKDVSCFLSINKVKEYFDICAVTRVRRLIAHKLGSPLNRLELYNAHVSCGLLQAKVKFAFEPSGPSSQSLSWFEYHAVTGSIPTLPWMGF